MMVLSRTDWTPDPIRAAKWTQLDELDDRNRSSESEGWV